jgi:hypothetical protein
MQELSNSSSFDEIVGRLTGNTTRDSYSFSKSQSLGSTDRYSFTSVESLNTPNKENIVCMGNNNNKNRPKSMQLSTSITSNMKLDNKF